MRFFALILNLGTTSDLTFEWEPPWSETQHRPPAGPTALAAPLTIFLRPPTPLLGRNTPILPDVLFIISPAEPR